LIGNYVTNKAGDWDPDNGKIMIQSEGAYGRPEDENYIAEYHG